LLGDMILITLELTNIHLERQRRPVLFRWDWELIAASVYRSDSFIGHIANTLNLRLVYEWHRIEKIPGITAGI